MSASVQAPSVGPSRTGWRSRGQTSRASRRPRAARAPHSSPPPSVPRRRSQLNGSGKRTMASVPSRIFSQVPRPVRGWASWRVAHLSRARAVRASPPRRLEASGAARRAPSPAASPRGRAWRRAAAAHEHVLLAGQGCACMQAVLWEARRAP